LKVEKPAIIIVMHLEDHCHAQELNNDLPVSYLMYKIFHSGSTYPLKVRAGCFAEIECMYPSPKKSWWLKGLNLFSGINIFRL
jgi:hypothetical protein